MVHPDEDAFINIMSSTALGEVVLGTSLYDFSEGIFSANEDIKKSIRKLYLSTGFPVKSLLKITPEAGLINYKTADGTRRRSEELGLEASFEVTYGSERHNKRPQ